METWPDPTLGSTGQGMSLPRSDHIALDGNPLVVGMKVLGGRV